MATGPDDPSSSEQRPVASPPHPQCTNVGSSILFILFVCGLSFFTLHPFLQSWMNFRGEDDFGSSQNLKASLIVSSGGSIESSESTNSVVQLENEAKVEKVAKITDPISSPSSISLTRATSDPTMQSLDEKKPQQQPTPQPKPADQTPKLPLPRPYVMRKAEQGPPFLCSNASEATTYLLGPNSTNLLDDFLTPAVTESSNLTLLHIGDSLDEHLVQDCFYAPSNGRYTNITLEKIGYLCLSPTSVNMAQFRIFGMHHDCPNGGYLGKKSKSRFNTTAFRVATDLPKYILPPLLEVDRVPTHVIMGSCLWDLSSGCNNHQNISLDFQEDYVQGIRDLYKAVRAVLPHTKVYWRTAPPISQKYDRQVTGWGSNVKNANRQGGGRTRHNQQVLNDLVRTTVRNDRLGEILDWWQFLEGVPEEHINTELQTDGRHYSNCAGFAFLNMVLNQFARGDNAR